MEANVDRTALRNRLLRATGDLGLRRSLRRTYRFLFIPNRGVHTLSVGGQTVDFYVHSQAAARALDSLGGERPTLCMLMGTLRPGDRFYDIGASTGIYSLFISQVVGDAGKVCAFEPEALAFERLEEHVELNALRNVTRFHVALGLDDRSVFLVPGKVSGEARIACEAGEPHGFFERVKVVRGDTFVEANHLPQPTAIKIDVEGYEFAVIQGFTRTLSQGTCRLVCCEVHPHLQPSGVAPSDVLDLLKSLGFTRIEIHQRSQDFHAWAWRL